MSITFVCPEAPSEFKRVACDSPALGLTCTAEERCGYCDDGWMETYVCEAPEVNLANVNAAAILKILGVSGNSVRAEDVSDLLRRILRAVNVDGVRADLVEEGREYDGHAPRVVLDLETGLPTISTGCRVINGGNTDEQTLDRLGRLQTLAVYAADHGYSVAWG